MTPEEPNSPGILKNLPVVEKVLLCALAIGAILAVLDINFTLLRASLIGVAAVFFLLAYRPPETETPREENEPGGFSELLALTIIPKVLWISSAVSIIGIAFYFISPENEGYKQMLFIGMTTLGTGLLLLAFFLVRGTKYLKTVVPILYRAVPALIAAIYFFFMK